MMSVNGVKKWTEIQLFDVNFVLEKFCLSEVVRTMSVSKSH